MNFVLYLVVYLHYACRPLYTSNIKKAYERLLFFFFFLLHFWQRYGLIMSFLEQKKKRKGTRNRASYVVIHTSFRQRVHQSGERAHHFFAKCILCGGCLSSAVVSCCDAIADFVPGVRFYCGGTYSLPTTYEAVFCHLVVGSSPAPWLSPALLTTNMHSSDRRR